MLATLKRKETPFFALDTHAGLGAYDLAGVAAEKTGEYRNGIAKVLEQENPPAALAPYLAAVQDWNGEGGLRWYPGSPEVIRTMMRPQDRLALVELHPEDVVELRRRFSGDRRVGVHHLDGYLAAKGLLPPPERRGLVLIDPPFESPEEFSALARTVREATRKFATGIFLIWYPIKSRADADAFTAEVLSSGVVKAMTIETRIGAPEGKLGCAGLLVINPPYGFAAVMEQSARLLAPRLEGEVTQAWLVGAE